MEIRLIVSDHDSAVGPLRAIYDASFPPDERVEFASIVGDAGHSEALFYERDTIDRLLVAEHSDTVVGFINTVLLVEPQFSYVPYVALTPSYRGRGLGRGLFAAATEQLRSDAEHRGTIVRGILLEVERLEDSAGSEDREIRERRLGFFHALGAVLLTRTYVQPALGEGKQDVPLNLLWIPLTFNQPGPQVVRDFYRVIFGLDDNEPIVQQAIAGIPTSVNQQ